MFSLTSFGQTSSSTGPQWTSLGPAPLLSATPGSNGDYGPIAGRVTAVVVDQNDATGNTVYIGAANGGVWKTANAAADAPSMTWTPLTDNAESLAVGSIAIQPGNPNLILVGTGETNNSADSYYGMGILRSTDAGRSWTLISSANKGLRIFRGLGFARIAFSADNPNVVVAAAAMASVGAISGLDQSPTAANCRDLSQALACRGIYYSQDAGQTWAAATMVDPGGIAPDGASATFVHYNPQQHKFYAAVRNHGFYASVDGISWKRIGSDPYGFRQPSAGLSTANCPSTVGAGNTCPIYRGEIAQVAGRDEMYVWFVNGDAHPVNGGIFQTTDGGKTWNTINVGGIENCGDSSGCGTEEGDYNLALIAIPNGTTATDLYAGAVNIYRCRITAANPTCAVQPFVSLTHAYGCDPIGSFSKVHPNQHSFDLLKSNANVLYFANDGGLYRTRDALGVHVVPAVCPATAPSQPFYPFENLNGTMGSLAQFVRFSQHPTDQFTLLGGTRNGTAAIDGSVSGANGTTWRTVLPGDGALTDINSGGTSEWVAANAGVSLRRCTEGTSCTPGKFTRALSPNRIGGDESAFHMAFVVDPKNVGRWIIGTCRVWRVASDGSSAFQLSYKFDGGAEALPCSRLSNKMITALAAGGPAGSNGVQVIYAGTEAGEIYITRAAGDTPSTWIRASRSPGFSNPQLYPISSIAIDPRDASGNTAYVTVRGFNTPHVFRTSNGGDEWTDITANLPNVPVNSAAVNPLDGSLYVGTDAGVFLATSLTANISWTKVGPDTGPRALPNAPVTHLAISSRDGKPALLRAATYGRGLWEIPIVADPTVSDYAIAILNPTQLTYPGSSVTFLGRISTSAGYSSPVQVRCDADESSLPPTCVPDPASVNPAGTGSFSVMASSPGLGDFSFRIRGTGGDASSLVRTASVLLRVVDFSVGAPQPAEISNLEGGDEATVKLLITPLGSFNQIVTVGCDRSSLPSGWDCSSASLQLSEGQSSEATFRIVTSASTPPGTYTVALTGTWTTGPGAVRTKTQLLPVSVVAVPAFSVSATEFAPATVKVTQPLNSTITVNPQNGYKGTVSLSCEGTSSVGITQDSCSFNPPSLSLALGSATSVLTVSTMNGTAGNGELNIQATDVESTRAYVLPFTLGDYTISGMTQPNDATSGGIVNFSFAFTASAQYAGSVAFSCDTSLFTVPLSCTFNPGSPVTVATGGSKTVDVSVAVPKNLPSGSYSISLKSWDQAVPALQHIQTTPAFRVSTAPDFSMSFTSTNGATITAGQSVTAPLSIGVQGDFTSTVTFTVSGCPSNATCTVSPASVSPNSTAPASATLSITTKAASTASAVAHRNFGYFACWILLSAGALGLVGGGDRPGRRAAILVLLLALFLGTISCGGGVGGSSDAPPVIHPGTPAGTYTITITGTGGTIVRSVNFTLTVQ